MRTHGVLGAAVALLLVAGVVVGCSTEGPGTSADGGTPARSAAPDPATVSRPLWEAGTRGEDPLSSFKDTPYNHDGTDPPTVVDAPDDSGTRSIRFQLPGGGQRTEIEPDVPRFENGDSAYFGFAWYLPEDFPTAPGSWQVIAQWKNGGDGSPPLEISVVDDQFVLSGGAGKDEPFSQPLGPARTGTQTDLVVHIEFSDDPEQGTVDVWLDGNQVLRGFRPPAGTLYDGQDSYLKTGIYRDQVIEPDAELYLNDLRIAKDRDSASALA